MLTAPSPEDDLVFGVHWLAATVPVETGLDLDTVLAYIRGELHGADWSIRDRGVSGYTMTYETLFGLRVYANEDRPEMGIHMIADGDCCDAIGIECLRRIYVGLQMRATRIDLAVDNCGFSPADLRDEWHRDNVRTSCKPARNPMPGREGVRSCSWYSSPSGDTFNMGSRKATAFARCYNERGFTRFELELKGNRAVKVADLVLAEPSSASGTALSVIRDFVDFVDSSASSNRSRCPLLPFWSDFVVGVCRARVRLDPRPEPSIGRTIDWIEGQVARSLAVYETYAETLFGTTRDRVRRRLRRIGLSRIRPRHEALLRMALSAIQARSGSSESGARTEFQLSSEPGALASLCAPGRALGGH